MDPEAPEADVAEQQQEVVPDPPVETGEIPLESDPADALDQQREVPVDDDHEV